VARGEASALFSAGHTGATVMAAYAAFGMLPGVDRPALAATIPTRRRPAILLDVGASVECRPQHLLQFAIMGSVYARVAFGLENPRVGLLSIGEEATKGNELTREALRRFKRRVDYSEYGGAPLLGLAGVTIVGHGRSSAKAVRNAVALGYRFASQRFIERVEQNIAEAAAPRALTADRSRMIAFIFSGHG